MVFADRRIAMAFTDYHGMDGLGYDTLSIVNAYSMSGPIFTFPPGICGDRPKFMVTSPLSKELHFQVV